MDLPKVFANKIDREINNSQVIFFENERNNLIYRDEKNIIKKINNIFSSPNHVYKSKVEVETSKGKSEKIIVGKTNGSLITIDGELIKIRDIIDIRKI